MAILFLILTVVAAAALGFVILVQNPKGGGLAGNVGGISNQFMGVKQTTDVLEKGTWLFAGIIALLALFSSVLLKGSATVSTEDNLLEKVNTNAPAAAPANAVPMTSPAKPADSTKK
jgi:preprotein translocase subunit SecG